MEYNFKEIEQKWQEYWADKKTFKADNSSSKPKYYVLDMFPYPSGAGLHVGHPLGYIASDIYARYKRIKGFNVLHPMGYDAFGLPAEQYAIQTGQHPAITTEQNIARYRTQLDKIGFSFDWDREVRTSDPKYYKWTQWIFIQLFNSWYNKTSNKAEAITTLIAEFEKNGNQLVNAACEETGSFSAAEWKAADEKQQQEILLNYRLTYLSETMVNWCPGLGTVLANEEIKDGLSERGGYPVVRKLMKQWSMRITAYADRLLNDLEEIDWSDSIKEQQRNWIGKSEGSSVIFEIKEGKGAIEVFTTRPDTIFGATFVTLAPEHELVEKITTPEYKKAVEEYIGISKNRSERERMADVKKITGQFTGAYAIHPFSGSPIPIWIGDYVLPGYGTGAVMAVPAHDARDYAFAKHFNLPIVEVVSGGDISIESYDAKEGTLINSDFLNGFNVKEAIKKVIQKIEEKGIGKGKTNFRLRDAIFSRQRYWGEPIPVYYKNDIPYVLDEKELPLELPEVDAYLPTESGEPPLARAKNWNTKEGYPYEASTMPGWAGSSWYFYRYMDAKNENEFVSKKAVDYWQDVDLYIGGSEHATGHLLYARFWNKFLYDLEYIPKKEPFKKLINQGMIQGESKKARVIHRIKTSGEGFATYFDEFYDGVKKFIQVDEDEKIDVEKLEPPKTLSFIVPYDFPQRFSFELEENIPIEFTQYSNGKYILEREKLESLKKEYPKFQNYFLADFQIMKDFWDSQFREKPIPSNLENYFVKNSVTLNVEVEKMSKSKWNVVSPDDIVDRYGADTLRLYEMFLGPLEQSKPWNTNGIEGVHRFLKKLWRLYHDAENNFSVSDEAPTPAELKTLHKTIKKVQEDIDRFSFNTSVSNFMICVNELTDLKCNKRSILQELTILLSPYAPHIAEELWSLLGNKGSISEAVFPEYHEAYLVESNFSYAISFNGKTRFMLDLPASLTKEEIEKEVLSSEEAKKWLEGNPPKKVIVVPKKIVNIVV